MGTSRSEIARAKLAKWLNKRKFIGNIRLKAEYVFDFKDEKNIKQTGEKTKTDKQVDTKSLNAWIRAFLH